MIWWILSEIDILTCLIHLGYLGYDQDTHSAFVPKQEIRQELAKAVKRKEMEWISDIPLQESSELLDATLDMDTDTVARSIEKYNEYLRYSVQQRKLPLSSILSIGYLSTSGIIFKPIREFPAGRGFADFIYLQSQNIPEITLHLLLS